MNTDTSLHYHAEFPTKKCLHLVLDMYKYLIDALLKTEQALVEH